MVAVSKPTPRDFPTAVEFSRIAEKIDVLRDKLADLEDYCREMAAEHPDAADLFLGVCGSLIDLESDNLLVEENREFGAAADRWEDAA